MKSFRGKTILITAGPTWEMMDPVRFLSNRSSGQLGYAIARTARMLGAKVILVSGPTALPPPKGVTVIPVVSAREMYRACLKHFSQSDIAIMTAAVADYRPAEVARHKLKKCLDAGSKAGMMGKTMTLKLIRNPDILTTLGHRKKRQQILVGFALESRQLLKYAQDKLRRKNCDLIVANSVPSIGASEMSATVLSPDGVVASWHHVRKPALARRLLSLLSATYFN